MLCREVEDDNILQFVTWAIVNLEVEAPLVNAIRDLCHCHSFPLISLPAQEGPIFCWSTKRATEPIILIPRTGHGHRAPLRPFRSGFTSQRDSTPRLHATARRRGRDADADSRKRKPTRFPRPSGADAGRQLPPPAA